MQNMTAITSMTAQRAVAEDGGYVGNVVRRSETKNIELRESRIG